MTWIRLSLPSPTCLPRGKLATLQEVGLGYLTLAGGDHPLGGERLRGLSSPGNWERGAAAALFTSSMSPHTGLISRIFASCWTCSIGWLRRQHRSGHRAPPGCDQDADCVIDLGPEGGEGGGRVVGSGAPEEIASLPASHTGQYLKKILDLSG